VLALLLGVCAWTSESRAAIGYVQGNSVDPNTTSATSVAVAYSAAQTAGNLNVVAIGWGNNTSGTVSSVKDSKGNTYTLAIGPTTSTSAGGVCSFSDFWTKC
jgi:hypothetical protein